MGFLCDLATMVESKGSHMVPQCGHARLSFSDAVAGSGEGEMEQLHLEQPGVYVLWGLGLKV